MSHRRSAKRQRRNIRRSLNNINARILGTFPGAKVHTWLESSDASDSSKYGGQWYRERTVWSDIEHPHLGSVTVLHGEVTELGYWKFHYENPGF